MYINSKGELSMIHDNSKNINNILLDKSIINRKEEIDFFGVIEKYKHQKMYLKGNSGDIKCNIKKNSYETHKGEIYKKFVKRDVPTHIVLKGIPYYCNYSNKYAIKQAEIIEIYY